MASATKISGSAERDFARDRTRPEEHLARPLAVRAEQQQDEADQQHGVAERQDDDVGDVQPAVDEGAVAERGERAAERELGREVRADEDFDQTATHRVGRRAEASGVGVRGSGRSGG